MFSLIIVIVSIALLVVLVATTLYSGGDFLTQGRVESRAAQLVNEAQQLKGALARFKVENPDEQLNALSDLAPKYLSAIPPGWSAAHGVAGLEQHIAIPVPGDAEDQLEACRKANERMNIKGLAVDGEGKTIPPSCSSVPSSFIGCCQAN